MNIYTSCMEAYGKKNDPMFKRLLDTIEHIALRLVPAIFPLWMMALLPIGGYWIGTQITNYQYFNTQMEAQARIITAQFYAGAASRFADVLDKALEAK